MKLFDIIADLAKIPSWTTQEERIFPYIEQFIRKNMPIDTQMFVAKKSLIIQVPGNLALKPVALAAHLDKRDHWHDSDLKQLDNFNETADRLYGSLDDAAGVGCCLYLAAHCDGVTNPPFYLFLTEMEEIGLVGTAHISWFFDTHTALLPPGLIVNIDLSPQFGDKPGIAFSSEEENPVYLPFCRKTRADICRSEGISDAMVYEHFFKDTTTVIGLDPAVCGMHTKVESCYKQDLEDVVKIVQLILVQWIAPALK